MSPSTFLNFSDPPLQRAYQYRSFKRWMFKKSEQNVQFPDSHWQGDRTQNSSFLNSFIVPFQFFTRVLNNNKIKQLHADQEP